jgi:predicted alpha-1,2-mannosidase
LPIVAAPFGMGHWTLQTTSQKGPWFFHPEDRRVEGIRCTHQLSPWLGDYGSATVIPFAGSPNLDAGARASSYRPEELRLTPASMHLHLMRYGITVDLVPTERCAAMELAFSHSGQAGLCIALPGGSGTCVESGTRGLYFAASPDNRGGVAAGFATYYAVSVDADDCSLEVKPLQQEIVATIRFNVKAGQKVRVRIGTSFISHEQAKRNVEREIGALSLDQVHSKTAEVWEAQLGRARIVESNEARRKIFYSALYRASLFPRIWHEVDASESVVHRSPYTGAVLPGVMYADHGFWDVYRAWYPMMSLLYPDRLGEILQAWVNAAREGGWIPQFPCPGYRGAMSGSPSDSVFADAAVKKIQGFDLETAYAALRKHATDTQKPGPGYGRQGVADYLQYGYLPMERHGGALTETLDAAYGDFCIGQVAKVLGHEEDARMFAQRSQNWRKVYDATAGFLRPRLSNGQFPPDFVAHRWGNGYVEGSAWQYRFSVPHDPEGLIAAMGGPTAYVKALDELTAGQPDFEVGDYGYEIHEMSEMAAVDFGQYAHSNQPSHHILYMYAMAGRPDRTQYWVRRTLTELYSVDNFAGDEDTGSMAAWYVLSALGFYSLCPGRPWYVLGSPLFEEATLHLPHGVQTRIVAHNQAPDRPFVSACTMNGQSVAGVTIPHSSLASGGELVFSMHSIQNYRVLRP